MKEEASERYLGVALSGGGYRATLYSLGALLYLVDSGANKNIATVTSVSGGSVTNAYVAQECPNFGSVSSQEFDVVARKLASLIVKRSLWWPLTLPLAVYVTLIAAGFALVIRSLAVPIVSWWTLPIWLAAVGLLLLSRGYVVAAIFARLIFKGADGATRLEAMDVGDVGHVLCVTDLTSAGPAYFYCGHNRGFDSPELGRGAVGTLTLATAVRSSAAFPPLIPPKVLWTGGLRLPKVGPPPDPATGSIARQPKKPRLVALSDGGVWNNLGTQFFEQDPGRLSEERRQAMGEHYAGDVLPQTSPSEWPRKIIVADASAPTKRMGGLHFVVPIWATLQNVLRTNLLLYANTVRARSMSAEDSVRHWTRFGSDFDEDRDLTIAVAPLDARRHDHGKGITSAFDIGESEHAHSSDHRFAELNTHEQKVPESYSFCADGRNDHYEAALQRTCANVKTAFNRIPKKAALALLLLGYVRTQRVSHQTFGTGLKQPWPSLDRFEQLLEFSNSSQRLAAESRPAATSKSTD